MHKMAEIEFQVEMVPGGFRAWARDRGPSAAGIEGETVNCSKREHIGFLMIARLNAWLEENFPEQAPAATLMAAVSK